MSAQAYLCTSCSHRFTLETSEQLRCPKCLRQSGLAPDASESAAGRSNPSGAAQSDAGRSPAALVAVVLLAAVAATAGWYFMRDPGLPGSAVADPGSRGSGEAKALDVGAVPEPWADRLDGASPELEAAASSWAKDPAALVSEVARRVPKRSADMDFEASAPNTASELVGKKAGLRAGSLELASLTAALLRAQGVEAQYGYVADHHHAKTSILLRRFVVRAAGGAWLDPFTGQPAAGTVTALNAAEVLANTLATRAMVFIDHRKGDQASKAIGFGRRLAPEDPAIQFAYGEVMLFDELTDLGMSTLEKVAKAHADAMTWQTLGEYASQNRQLFKAQQFFLKAAEADQSYAKPYVMLAQLSLERLEVTPKAQHETLFGQIDAHVAKASTIDANAAGIRTIKAQVAMARGELEAAETFMLDEVKLHPASRNAVLSLAQFYINREKVDEAVEVLETAVKREVPGYELHLVLGGLLAHQELFATARDHMEKALALAPYDPRLRPQIAQLYALQGKLERARELLNEQVERFEKEATGARMLLAQLSLQEKKWDDASTHLDALGAAGASDPNVAIMRYLVALATKKGLDKAKAAAIAAVQKRSSLAQVLMEQGLIKDAEALLREALTKEPEDQQPPYMLVAMLSAQGRDEEAKAIIDAVVKKTPADALEQVMSQFKLAVEQGKKLSGAGAPPPPTPDAKPAREEPTGGGKPEAGGE